MAVKLLRYRRTGKQLVRDRKTLVMECRDWGNVRSLSIVSRVNHHRTKSDEVIGRNSDQRAERNSQYAFSEDLGEKSEFMHD